MTIMMVLKRQPDFSDKMGNKSMIPPIIPFISDNTTVFDVSEDSFDTLIFIDLKFNLSQYYIIIQYYSCISYISYSFIRYIAVLVLQLLLYIYNIYVK